MNLQLELLILVVLVLTNGLLAMSETALVSVRSFRLQRQAREGNRRAALALEVIRSPGVYLSTIQIGITLVGVWSGAFGGTTLAVELEQVFNRLPGVSRYSGSLSLALVVLGITYLTLVLGELVPKRLALSNPEKISGLAARPMRWLSRLATPLVWILARSTDSLFRLMGGRGGSESEVTEEEITLILEQGAAAGRFEEQEPRIVERLFRLADQRVGALSTPRSEIDWLEMQAPPEELRRKIKESRRSRLPVCEGSLDRLLGVVRAKRLLGACLDGEALDLRSQLEPVPFVPESAPALSVLEVFRQERLHLAIVIDEYGGVQGLVTTDDILEALVGRIPEPGEGAQPGVRQTPEGGWLLDGLASVESLKTILGVRHLPGEERGLFKTVGGFVMTQLQRVPEVGDELSWRDYRIRVTRAGGLRVEEVHLTRQARADVAD